VRQGVGHEPFDGLRGDRQPPLNYEAEQALLAALLANNGVFGQIVGMVVAEDFADPLHGRIFAAARPPSFCPAAVAHAGELSGRACSPRRSHAIAASAIGTGRS
jgi:hypothetical protein